MKHAKRTLLVGVIVMSSLAASEGPRLHFVTTARQFGPVGYRDPAGAMSPDGVWLAYSVGRMLRTQRIDGGPVHEVGAINSQIRYIAWLPNSRHVAVQDRDPDSGARSWLVFDVITGRRSGSGRITVMPRASATSRGPRMAEPSPASWGSLIAGSSGEWTRAEKRSRSRRARLASRTPCGHPTAGG